MLVAQNFCALSVCAHQSEPPPHIQLTAEERLYLDHKEKLTYCSVPSWMPYSNNEDGNHIGILADYVLLFSKMLNTPFEYVSTSTWTDSLIKARERECDLVSAIVDKISRHDYLDFTTPYLETSLALVTSINAPHISNIRALDGKKIAAVKGYASTSYIRDSFPNLILVEVNSVDQGMQLVANNKVYGMADTLGVLAYKIQNHYFHSLKLNGTFTDTYKNTVGTRNDEPILNAIMQKVVNAISEESHRHIFANWISDSVLDKDSNALTLEELDFITNHPKIRFRIRSNRPPFEFEIDGQAHGLAVDYIRHITESVGLEAEFVIMNMPPSSAIQELQKEDSRFDTIAYWVASDKRRDLLNFGDVYLTYPMVIISSKDDHFITSLSDLNHRQVVVEKGFLTNRWLSRDYPQINIVNAIDTIHALKMVNEGKVDAYVGNLAVTNYLIASGEMDNIKVAAPTEYGNINYSFVAPKKWPELASILSKGYRDISSADHTSIRANWFTMQRIETTNYSLLFKVLLAALALLFISIRWNARISRAKNKTEQTLKRMQEMQEELELKNEELRHLSVTDVLTGLNNRARLEVKLQEQIMCGARYPEHEFGVIMIDIDRFKLVNDTYGHQAGDLVLRSISTLFKQHIREVDAIGRWGGEEFLIIAPRSNKSGLIQLAEKLRTLLENHKIEKVGRVTSSFGIAVFDKGDSAESLLSRADRALYVSKDSGRNKVSFLEISQ